MTIFLSIRFCNAKMEQRLRICYSGIQMAVASSLLFAVLQQRNFTRLHTFCLRLARCRQIQRPVECLVVYYHNLQDKLIDQFFGYRKRRGIYPAIQRLLNPAFTFVYRNASLTIPFTKTFRLSIPRAVQVRFSLILTLCAPVIKILFLCIL